MDRLRRVLDAIRRLRERRDARPQPLHPDLVAAADLAKAGESQAASDLFDDLRRHSARQRRTIPTASG